MGNEWTPGDWQLKERPGHWSAISGPIAGRMKLQLERYDEQVYTPEGGQRTSIRSAIARGRAAILAKFQSATGRATEVLFIVDEGCCAMVQRSGIWRRGSRDGGSRCGVVGRISRGRHQGLAPGLRSAGRRSIVDVAAEVVVERRARARNEHCATKRETARRRLDGDWQARARGVGALGEPANQTGVSMNSPLMAPAANFVRRSTDPPKVTPARSLRLG